ncbi:MAG: D-tyrosyl-tRNA(Tyr) deacylase [Balneolia bacterium]|nr:D-tyrosyl-tRNA(Tyr) deacylase [Balneolia bacterium]
MRLVVQRVSSASVAIDGKTNGSIDKGLVVLAAVHRDDDIATVKWAADKMMKLRIFEDEDGKMNRSVTDVGGGLLLISQFTLYGDARKGTRPSFIESAPPEKAEQLYDEFVSYTKAKFSGSVETGVFAAMMDVSLVNDGPVTIIIEKQP